jgi:phage-related protein
MREVGWIGSSLDELRGFSDKAKQRLGYQLDRVQRGETPTDSRAVPDIGKGAVEIRVTCDQTWYRLIYVAGADAIWVIHCFQKKSNSMAREDVDLAKKRYKQIPK